MIEQGVVLAIQKEFAKVRVERNSACGSCGKCGMTESQKHVDFLASNAVGATVGDTVSLDIPDTNSAKWALVGYFIPLIPALGLQFLALGLHLADWIATLMFVGGLAVGFAVVALIDKLRRHKWMETPQIVEIVHTAKVQAPEQNDVQDDCDQNLIQNNEQAESNLTKQNQSQNNEQGENNE